MTHNRVSGFFMREAQSHLNGGACGGAVRLAGFMSDRLRQPCTSHHLTRLASAVVIIQLLEITLMNKDISPDTLSPIAYNQIPVVTTELLAQLYGTETNNIKVNFTRNTDRFVEGKHFFKLEGDELREMKHRVTQSNSVKIHRNARSLILWTERGAARHAKMLETDQAWEVFERLEDCYFSAGKKDISPVKIPRWDKRYVCYESNGHEVHRMPMMENDLVISMDGWLQYVTARGWLVVRKEEVREMTMEQLARLLVE